MYFQLDAKSSNILAFKILGGVTKSQQKQICKVLEKQIAKSGKIRLFVLIESRRTLDAESLLFDLNFAFVYSDKIERMAIVGSKTWEETCAALFGLFARIRTEFFDRSEATKAWEWLQGSG